MDHEKALIKGCAKGEAGAQKKLYEVYASRLLVVSMRYAKSDQEAEDVLQEAFIKIFKKIKDFRSDSSLYYWMKRIVVNTALNHRRSKLYLFPMVDVSELKNQVGQRFTLSDHDFKDLLKMIQELPSGCQVIFNLFAVEGYSHKEIAKKLNISEGTSKSQYARARSLLRQKINEDKKRAYKANSNVGDK